jgi:hypothetical protein
LGGAKDRLRIPFTAPDGEITEAITRVAEAWTAYLTMANHSPASVHAIVV